MRCLLVNKGVSTIIATGIFIILFMTSTLTMLLIFRNYVNYFEAVKEEGEFLINKMSEKLILEFKNSSGNLLVKAFNPTAKPVIITQVWSNHSFQMGEWMVPSQGNITISTNINYTEKCKVVTSYGNIFTAEKPIVETPMAPIMGRWYVQWYDYDFTTKIGESYWYDLSFEWSNLYYYGYSRVAFNATTNVTALSSIISITVFLAAGTDHARIIIDGVDSGWKTGKTTFLVEKTTSPGARHTMIILYRGSPPLGISINIVNADFAM